MPRQDLIQIRRGTAANWTSTNPTLANGEFGFETDTGKLKCGNGSSAWVELGYVSSDVSLQTNPVENEYADITALLADQGNQTETFFQYVLDASSDPNVASGDAYYEKLSGSTGTLATDYRLLSDTETQIITDSNGYRVFRIQYIQDDSSPNDTANGGRIGFNYDTGTDKVTSVVFNNIYSNALDIFYTQRASNTYKLKFYNRNTGVYSFATVTGWTVNGNYYIVDVDSGIDISEISVNNRIELFFEIDNSGGSGLPTGGTQGQILVKQSGTDGDADWESSTSGTGTAIALSIIGSFFNTATPSTSTSYTLTGSSSVGAWAKARSSSSTASEPTVTGATQEGGVEWQSGVEYDIFIIRDDEGVKYSFIPTATIDNIDFISGLIDTVSEQDYKMIVKVPYSGIITETTTISTSGTCTATFKINSTALGGTANSVSTSEQSQAHSSSNTFSAGDDLVLTVSSNSACLGLSFTIKFTKS